MKTSPTPPRSGLPMAAFEVPSIGTQTFCAYPSKDLAEIKSAANPNNIGHIAPIFDLNQTSADMAKAQSEIWATVVRAAAAQPNPVLALAVSGMNDVFNTLADTQAAWLNRIPTAAWALMILIAIFSNLLLGYRDRSSGRLALLVLPVIASIAFFLIADIDSPYLGVISVAPHNLMSTSQAMKP